VAWSHGDNGEVEDRPPPHHVPSGCMGCFANRGKGKQKPNLGDRAAGRLNTRDKTRNLSLKDITDTKGPVPIQFELRNKQTVMPLGDHAAHWSIFIGEVIRDVPLYYPSWLKTQFDLRPHMESPNWTEINAGIQQHLQKAYNTNKAAFKAQHWVIDPTTETYNVEKIRREHSDHAGCLDSHKSTPSGIQFLGGDKLVSWSSKKQNCTSMSFAEAEYVSLSACCTQVLWKRTQLIDYGFYFDKIPMYCDSKAAIAISCIPVQHSRTKHIDVRYHFIKEKVEKDIIELFFVETKYQLADLFTKALPVERYEMFNSSRTGGSGK
nr:putative RNA-directed DNA polymerase [Tanacetum cinerariifolium]